MKAPTKPVGNIIKEQHGRHRSLVENARRVTNQHAVTLGLGAGLVGMTITPIGIKAAVIIRGQWLYSAVTTSSQRTDQFVHPGRAMRIIGGAEHRLNEKSLLSRPGRGSYRYRFPV